MSKPAIISIVAVAVAIAATAATLSQERSVSPGPSKNARAPEPGDGLTGRDRQRLEEAGPATVKMFVVALRKRFTNESAAELREFIDPRYLKEHQLQDGALPIRRVVTKDIYDNQPSDDPRTILIVAETEEAAKEAFLFRTSVYEGKVYVLPLAPPDPKTGSFKPWILRMKL